MAERIGLNNVCPILGAQIKARTMAIGTLNKTAEMVPKGPPPRANQNRTLAKSRVTIHLTASRTGSADFRKARTKVAAMRPRMPRATKSSNVMRNHWGMAHSLSKSN